MGGDCPQWVSPLKCGGTQALLAATTTIDTATDIKHSKHTHNMIM